VVRARPATGHRAGGRSRRVLYRCSGRPGYHLLLFRASGATAAAFHCWECRSVGFSLHSRLRFCTWVYCRLLSTSVVLPEVASRVDESH
jgi:hypothetical protein